MEADERTDGPRSRGPCAEPAQESDRGRDSSLVSLRGDRDDGVGRMEGDTIEAGHMAFLYQLGADRPHGDLPPN